MLTVDAGGGSTLPYTGSSAAAEGISFNGSGLATTSHSISDIGVHTSQQSILVTGTHSAQSYADTATTPAAFTWPAPTDACFVHEAGSGKLYYQVGGVSMFSIAGTTGNAVFKGNVTPNGSP